MHRWLGPIGFLGGVIYALAGARITGGNLGWYDWSRDANGQFIWLGLGLLLVVGAFGVEHAADLWSLGRSGKVAALAGVVAPVVLLTSRLIEFAIFGTLSTFVLLAAFTRAAQHHGRLPRVDVAVLAVATVGSITWNTENGSAALLIGVGGLLAIESLRMLSARRWGMEPA